MAQIHENPPKPAVVMGDTASQTSNSSAPSNSDSDGSSASTVTIGGAVKLDAPQRYAQSGIMKIYVGRKRKLFEVHKDLLKAKSEYFRRLLSNPDWEETKNSEVYWTDEHITADAVGTMVDWLYGQKLEMSVWSLSYLDCYKLGHLYQMEGLQNDVVDALRSSMRNQNTMIKAWVLQIVQDLGLTSTPMETFIFRHVVWLICGSCGKYTGEGVQEIREEMERLSPALLLNIMEGVIRYSGEPFENPKTETGCVYHDHSQGSSCTA